MSTPSPSRPKSRASPRATTSPGRRRAKTPNFLGPLQPTSPRTRWEQRHGGYAGPGSYETTHAFGKQSLAGKTSIPSFSFGDPVVSLAKTKTRGYVVGTPANTDVPGPGSYSRIESVGKQSTSNRCTSPAFGFGTDSPRQKGNLKGEHIRLFKGNSLPHSARQPVDGAGKPLVPQRAAPGSYNLPSSIGKQADSSRPSTPTYSFGARLHVVHASTKVPGPGQYRAPDSVGKQASSRKRSSPRAKFGGAERFKYVDSTSSFPGPGSYTCQSSLGAQPLACNTSSPRPRFGTASRDSDVNRTRGNPGPGTYAVHLTTSLGASRVRKQAPQFVFGTSTRDSAVQYMAPEPETV